MKGTIIEKAIHRVLERAFATVYAIDDSIRESFGLPRTLDITKVTEKDVLDAHGMLHGRETPEKPCVFCVMEAMMNADAAQKAAQVAPVGPAGPQLPGGA